MLLGLVLAALFALALQLNAIRAGEPTGFGLDADGAIVLRAWIVLEAPAALGSAISSRPALAAPAARLRLVGQPLLVAPRPTARPRAVTPPPTDRIVVPLELQGAMARDARPTLAAIWPPPRPAAFPNPTGATLH